MDGPPDVWHHREGYKRGRIGRDQEEDFSTLTVVQAARDKIQVFVQWLSVISDIKLQVVCLYSIATCLLCHIMHVSV